MVRVIIMVSEKPTNSFIVKDFNDYPQAFQEYEKMDSKEYLGFLFSVAYLYNEHLKTELNFDRYESILKNLEDQTRLTYENGDNAIIPLTIVANFLANFIYIMAFKRNEAVLIKDPKNVSFRLLAKFIFTHRNLTIKKFD